MTVRRKTDAVKQIKGSIAGRSWEINLVNRKQIPQGVWSTCDMRTRRINVRVDLSPHNFLSSLVREVRYAQLKSLLPGFRKYMPIEQQAEEIAAIVMATGLCGIKRRGV